jgi:hypothetical protein
MIVKPENLIGDRAVASKRLKLLIMFVQVMLDRWIVHREYFSHVRVT